ncbi:hypothetical protein BH11PAT2_BH11PAT2_05500 [soil metagenome]
MRISNIKIDNFRNIHKADVSFGDLNVLTGRNASGKSNLLVAISNSLKTTSDFPPSFLDNVVTYSQGKSKATIEVGIDNIKTSYLVTENDEVLFFRPQAFRSILMFGKRAAGLLTHRLYSTGQYVREPSKNLNGENRFKDLESSTNMKNLSDDLVYEKNFATENIHESGDKQYIERAEVESSENAEHFFGVFQDYNDQVCSWVDPALASSAKIYQFVTRRLENKEVFDRVLSRLKTSDDRNRYGQAPLKNAHFISFLADIQRNDRQRDEFRNDLKLYTQNLLSDLFISEEGPTKGQIIVDSENAPRDIYSISSGTAVMIYFIVMKNWVQLPLGERAFQKPAVMLFDEVDAIIHPSMINLFVEVLRSLSKSVQLFISTHSPHFVNEFERSELYWLRNTTSLLDKSKNNVASSSIYSYDQILEHLGETQAQYFLNKSTTAELFVDGALDSLFPLITHN